MRRLGRRRQGARRYPVIVNARDRVAPLRALVDWLEATHRAEIHLLDNASTYRPLLEYLDASPHHVVRLDSNLGHRAPWLSGLVAELGVDRPFVVTDPDVVPDEDCPLDALDHLAEFLDELPGTDKAGFGLRIDDLPAHYVHRDDVIRWERQFWVDEVRPGVFRATVDTTFAVYRPGLGHQDGRSVRTGPPYVARHLPWYADTVHPTEEEEWYRAHADVAVTHWDRPVLPVWLQDAIAGQPDAGVTSRPRPARTRCFGNLAPDRRPHPPEVTGDR